MKILVQKRLNLYEKILELLNISEKNMYSQIILHNTSGETITMNKLKKIIPNPISNNAFKDIVCQLQRHDAHADTYTQSLVTNKH